LTKEKKQVDWKTFLGSIQSTITDSNVTLTIEQRKVNGSENLRIDFETEELKTFLSTSPHNVFKKLAAGLYEPFN